MLAALASWRLGGPVITALGAVSVSFLITSVGPGREWAAQASDALQPAGQADDSIVVVAIDATTLERGSWLPQQDTPGNAPVLHAALIDALDAAGAESILYDPRFDISSPDFTDLAPLADAARRAGRVVVPLEALGTFDTASSVVSGFALPTSTDQVVRRVETLVRQPDGDLFASFPFAAWLETLGPDVSVSWGSSEVRVDDVAVPVDAQGRMRVRYVEALVSLDGPRIISADRVLTGDLQPGQLTGKTVVVGVVAEGVGRFYSTPLGRPLPEPLIQANVLNTLFTRSFLTPASAGTGVLFSGFFALLVAWLAHSSRWWLAPLGALLSAVVAMVSAWQAFEAGIVLSPLQPLLAIIVSLMAGLGVRGAREFAHRRRVTELFSAYVPATVALQLLNQGQAESAAAGERVRVAVLFCDLRGFTGIAAALAPAKVRELLQVYYEYATSIIHQHNGTVMQFVGDEVFAVFGAPLGDADHPDHALSCAVTMQKRRVELDASLRERDIAPVAFGIGVHVGEVVAAHVGARVRRQYVVVGDTVNVGARLCSVARAGDVVASADAVAHAKAAFSTERLGPLDLKGVTRRVDGHRLAPPAA